MDKVEIEIDVDVEMIESLKYIARGRLERVVDSCSMELFVEDEIFDTTDLENACGRVVLNSIFIEAIDAAIKATLDKT